MKLVITGSLGHISKPLTEILLQKQHEVTVISSRPAKQKDIEALGAKAAIGSIEDTDFLTGVFKNADAAYCITPPDFTVPDQVAYYESTGAAYAKAIRQSGIKRVVYLSSYGAHLSSGTGIITGSYKAEQLLNAVGGIALTHIRPTYFYYNLLGFIGMIKAAGFIGAVYGREDKLPMVAPQDIAKVVAAEITTTNNIAEVCYVTSDNGPCTEIARVLGAAIGNPGLQWLVLPPEQVMQSLMGNGLSINTATNLVELGLAAHSGILREDYDKHYLHTGSIKLEDFAKEFAAVYNNQ